jgi:hypothetical protein
MRCCFNGFIVEAGYVIQGEGRAGACLIRVQSLRDNAGRGRKYL